MESITDPPEPAGRYDCPICFEILAKPCVIPECGHVFCFWCLHKSMDPYARSMCPLCRKHYEHQPKVAEALHHYLSSAFPQQYAARLQNFKDTEEASGVFSQPIDSHNPFSVAAPGHSSDPFHCVACHRLAARPAALTCGHLVCGAPSPCAAAATTPPATCPGCSDAVGGGACPSLQLGELLAGLHPEEYARRCAESAAVPPSGAATAAEAAPKPPDSPQDATVWVGVGCDGCGVYPITGKRFHCRDCPEAMGFDLCGACQDRELPELPGRFNQRHSRSHRMEEVPRETDLLVSALMRAANPGLPISGEQFSEILRMVRETDVWLRGAAPREEGVEPEPLEMGPARRAVTRLDEDLLQDGRDGPAAAAEEGDSEEYESASESNLSGQEGV